MRQLTINGLFALKKVAEIQANRADRRGDDVAAEFCEEIAERIRLFVYEQAPSGSYREPVRFQHDE